MDHTDIGITHVFVKVIREEINRDRSVLTAFHTLSSINHFSFREQEFVVVKNILSQISYTIEQKDAFYFNALRLLFGLFFITLSKQNLNVAIINNSLSNHQNIVNGDI
ncbi:hypothetical protein J5U18_13610 [Sphingobacteriaceae bacterium WQ 2009]|uniref:Uncharacterized protein n=1 Tax=Rhinopithecimicrobium faecis TaxID=2820698 RepID=A0A8T4HBT2_9SPHI|nr:hypothetical protein [Sphingobacteriaceae bacterium WQ 2009]